MSWIDVTTIGDVLLRAAERWPDREAVAFPERRSTYAELAQGARRVARGLHALGVRRGDHVGVLMPNCTEMVESVFGTLLLGAVVCPVNARYRSGELAFVVEHADHVVVLTSSVVAEHVDLVGRLHDALPGLSEASGEAPLALAAAPRLRHVVVLDGAAAPGPLGREVFAARAAAVGEDVVDLARAAVRVRDAALLLYTSGTTANPKGCLSTHEALVRGARSAQERWRVTGDDVIWNPMPLFHHAALQPLLYTLDRGARFCSVTHFEAGSALGQIAREQPTVLEPLFPTMTVALVNHPEWAATDLSALRLFWSIGTPDLLRHVRAALPPGVPLLQGTGLTEGGGLIALGDPDDDPETTVTTIGRPFPGVELRLVDESGADLPAGTPGELLVRGFTLFERYHKDPEQTAAILDEDGWVHTGDRYVEDEVGRVTFLGRIKEMLKVGGENVAPAEIESFLATHPAVHMVQAFGIPDARLDEVPAAVIELKPGTETTAEEMIDYCRGRIASYKVPRHVRFVEEWPMSATKIQKFRLREALLAELGIDDPQ